jgi:hypothetical protein
VQDLKDLWKSFVTEVSTPYAIGVVLGLGFLYLLSYLSSISVRRRIDGTSRQLEAEYQEARRQRRNAQARERRRRLREAEASVKVQAEAKKIRKTRPAEPKTKSRWEVLLDDDDDTAV